MPTSPRSRRSSRSARRRSCWRWSRTTSFSATSCSRSPVQAMRRVSHDLTLRRPLELADGTTVTALDVQWELFDRARKYAEEQGFDVGRRERSARDGAPVGGGARRPGDGPDVGGRPASTGWPSTACSTDTASATTSPGTTPGWRRWTCSTTTCGRQVARRTGRAGADHERRRGRPGRHRAARGHPGLLPRAVPAEVGRRRSLRPTGTRWCSTSAANRSAGCPMMEPMRGTKAHVGSLLDECATPAELLERLST